MKKIIKRMKKGFLLLCFMHFGQYLFAQGYPVIDVANLLESIESAFQTYQQVQNTIQQIQNQYQQIQQSVTQMKNINFDDLKNLGENFNGLSENPLEAITAVRNSAQQITAAVNKNMNKVNRVKDALRKESISFGGMNVSIADLCGAGDSDKTVQGFTRNAFDHIQGVCEDIGKTYTEGLTPEEKIAIMRKYGMSPRNYATIKASEAQLNELVVNSNIEGTNAGIAQELEAAIAEQNIINDIVSNKLPEGSTYSLMQLQTRTLTNLSTDFTELINTIKKQTALESQKIIADSTKEAVNEQTKKEEEDKEKKSYKQGIPKERNIY